jgi:hypothetical protein
MSALSRVLREDGKRSIELVTNIIYTFFCFSNFTEFHPVVTANKLGDMCFKITDQELNRFQILQQDIKKAEEKAAQTPNDKTVIAQLAQEHQKFQKMIRKQDQLLFLAFHLLLNIAEDLTIEVKMIKRDVIQYLFKLLDRSSPELVGLALTFLKKLSVFQENKNQILQNADTVCTILEFVLKLDNQTLQSLALRLALNLSHDVSFRKTLIKKNLSTFFVPLLSSKQFLSIALQLLYQLSIDLESRNEPIFMDILPSVLGLILEHRGERVNFEIMALAVNLSTIYPVARQICQDNGLKYLLKKSLKNRDPILFKMLRALSSHDDINIKLRFLDGIDEMMGLMLRSKDNPNLLVEILGILGNLIIPDFDFVKLSTSYRLLDFLSNVISDSIHQNDQENIGIEENDDILLQAIILVGTMSIDDSMSDLISKSNILPLLVDTMMGRMF